MTALTLDQTYSQAPPVRFSPEFAPAVMARIRPSSDGSFEYAEPGDGREAAIYPVEMDDGSIIDHVAWFRDRPRKWYRERLVGTHLGDWALRRAAFLQEPVKLLPTPSEWIASREESMCVLDWNCDLRALFREVPVIQCTSKVPGMATRMVKFLDRRLAEQVCHRFKITTVNA
jgi:hypothetical protein